MKNPRGFIKEFPSYRQRPLVNAILNRGNARYLVRSVVFSRNKVNQTSGTTVCNRYPAIFAASQRLVTHPAPRLLSFGCSTGEEVLTLREYFPDAVIVGSEVHKERLKIRRALTVDDDIIFIDSSKKRLSDNGPYDAIFFHGGFAASSTTCH